MVRNANLGDLECQLRFRNSIGCRTPIRRLSKNGSLQSDRKRPLASITHSIAEIDKWEQAHLKEDEIRSKVKDAKKQYEDHCAKSSLGFDKGAFRNWCVAADSSCFVRFSAVLGACCKIIVNTRRERLIQDRVPKGNINSNARAAG